VLGGKAKLGKSWLGAGIAIAVAMGGYALGSIKVEQGDVLLLALEDNERRLKKRLNQLLPNGRKPDRLFYDLTCGRLDQGLVDDLREWIEHATNPRLIVIDVLNKIRPAQKPNEGIYDYDVRSLEGLQTLAAEYGIAIIVVHHTRKAEADDPFDCLSGSTGLTGTADSTLILSRDSGGVILYGRGRDLEEFEKALSFDRTTGHWSILGEADEARRSNERGAILSALRTGGVMSPADICAATGMKSENVRFLLFKMTSDGQVMKCGRRQYAHPDNPPPTNITNAANNDYRSARDGADDDES
jgi:hypothetical protein